MKILIYHGKHGDRYWLADTPQHKDGAMRTLFEQLDEDGCYEDSDYCCAPAVLRAARQSDMGAIRRLLTDRNGCEYESWELVEAEIA